VAATWGTVKRAWHAQHPVLATQAPGVRSPRGHSSSLTLGAYNNFFFKNIFLTIIIMIIVIIIFLNFLQSLTLILLITIKKIIFRI
jgi:hypothetical protein